MEALLLWIGRVAGISGAVVCGLAGGIRLTGQHWFGGFQLATLLEAGMALMVLACLCFLTLLTDRSMRSR
jgi:hypothetical protein